MKLVIAASPEVAIPTIETLRSSNHEIVQIVTQPDRLSGRGLVLTATPIGQKYECKKPEDESSLREILAGSDLLITIGYGRILSEQTLSIPKFGGVNLHFSLLPKWRGAAPVQRSLEAGDRQTGVTVFKMDKGMDTGKILKQVTFDIPDYFYAQDLFKALSQLGASAVIATLDNFEKILPSDQNGIPTVATKINPGELKIDWAKSAVQIRNKVRGLGPATFTTFRGKKLKISKVGVSNFDLSVGEIVEKNQKLFIGTSDKALEILSLTPEGKREVSGSDFVNGARLIPGDVVA